MDPYELIEALYGPYPVAKGFLIIHSEAVAKMALEIAARIGGQGLDDGFIGEAALLHDIGIFKTRLPRIGCFGERPYICHGVIGREILDGLSLTRHALVCERHVGVGLTAKDITLKGFPMPPRDMTPKSMEEQIICFADKFYSKDEDPGRRIPLDVVRDRILRYGEDKLEIFDGWLELFGA